MREVIRQLTPYTLQELFEKRYCKESGGLFETVSNTGFRLVVPLLKIGLLLLGIQQVVFYGMLNDHWHYFDHPGEAGQKSRAFHILKKNPFLNLRSHNYHCSWAI